MKTTIPHISIALMVFSLSGCGKAPDRVPASQTVGDVVTNLVARAQTNDTAYFSGLLDAAVSNQAPQLISMIQRSGMATNFVGRLRKDSATQARLDYHDEEHNCHFQVDLQQSGADWKVRRIYFCR
jgi:predicted small lipoprotein YifL